MKKQYYDELCGSIKEMGKILRGELKPSRVFRIDPKRVKSVRRELHLSQEEFARLFKISIGTLRGWEQGRQAPEGPALALLEVIEKKPEAVLEALSK
jgi:putative transcriptional regulator